MLANKEVVKIVADPRVLVTYYLVPKVFGRNFLN